MVSKKIQEAIAGWNAGIARAEGNKPKQKYLRRMLTNTLKNAK